MESSLEQCLTDEEFKAKKVKDYLHDNPAASMAMAFAFAHRKLQERHKTPPSIPEPVIRPGDSTLPGHSTLGAGEQAEAVRLREATEAHLKKHPGASISEAMREARAEAQATTKGIQEALSGAAELQARARKGHPNG
jgi:acyl-CoA thioesterase